MNINENSFLDFLQKKASCNKKKILFPESNNIKILKAASICQELGISDCILLGNFKKVSEIARSYNFSINKNIEFFDPKDYRYKYLDRLKYIYKKKGKSLLNAEKNIFDDIIFSMILLDQNIVDGIVAGIEHQTSKILKSAFKIISIKTPYHFVSSFFLMLLPKKNLIYADCAININPDAKKLANIAIQTAESSKLFNFIPKIAFLSYFTGLSISPELQKINSAVKLVKENTLNLCVDGPIQYDAAVSESVSKIKCPNSLLRGKANIMIFPDLNSGNITYKAVQRSSNTISIGPILQGLLKPVNDLSRGSSINDIIYTVAVTVIQANQKI